MRLQPSLMASSTMASVTSRHNKAPETSRSVNPSCTPALSKSACRDRGAKRSRAFTTSNIFTLITYLECKGKELSVIPQTFYPFFASLTPFLPHSSLPYRAGASPPCTGCPTCLRRLSRLSARATSPYTTWEKAHHPYPSPDLHTHAILSVSGCTRHTLSSQARWL